MNKKKKSKVTIGQITNSRGSWGDIKPTTQIIEGKKKKNDRKTIKQKLNKFSYSEAL
jgi:hypothetical protein